MSCQFSKDGSKERSVFGRKIVYYPGRVRLCPGEMAAYVTPNQFDNPQLWSSLRGSLRLAAAAFRRPSWKPAKTFPFHCSRIAPVPKKKHFKVRQESRESDRMEKKGQVRIVLPYRSSRPRCGRQRASLPLLEKDVLRQSTQYQRHRPLVVA